MASYSFTLKVLASGGATYYTDFATSVVYDCIYDNITYVPAVPPTSTNSRAGDMVMVGLHPVTNVTGHVGGLTAYDLDLRTLFTNNASAYCPITSYGISKVFNYSSGYVYSSSQWGQFMSLQASTGRWELTDLSDQLMNLYVFAVAYNGKVWGNYTQSQIIEVNLEPRPFVDIYPPAFDGALLPFKLTFNRTEHLATDWSHPRTEGNRTYTHVLPAITEP